MSDKYIQLNSFKYGLDGRRDVLTSVPGTLQSLVNAHINAGGEIEGRAAFVPDATSYPSNCFGLQATDSGLMVFGSDAAAGGALPTNVVYQQLKPPAGIGAMTSVVYSCNYLGKAFVIATFSGAAQPLCYYNGTLVFPSRNGLVLPDPNNSLNPETVSELAQDLADQINRLPGWTATANFAVIGGILTATPGAVVVTSPPSIHFSPVTTVDSTAGQLSGVLVDQNFLGQAAKSALVTFTLNAGTNGTVNIQAPNNKAYPIAGSIISITGAPINFHTSLTQTAADIVSTINLLSGSTGYTAQNTGATITVYAPSGFGNFTQNCTVVTTGDITTIAGGGVTTQFVLTLSPGSLDVSRDISKFSSFGATVSGQMTASTSGSTGAVSFLWSETNADGSPVSVGATSGISLSSTTGSTVTFSKYMTLSAAGFGTAVLGYFKCVATDAGSGKIVTKLFTVKLQVFPI